ncbi:hypothetical protein V490_06144 [Pseudogymnoascus sp. VKM F-3557]|nr:hypothetical protein V490_06144 [Pseudogymnoascus sp. VKM F-3557]
MAMDYGSQGPTATAISIVFAVMTAIVISLRLFSRIYIVRSTGLDDILMVIAALLSWAFIAMTILAVNHGLGSHIDVVMAKGADNFLTYLKIVYFSSIFYNATLCFIKLSVLALYMRLGDDTLHKMSIVMMGVIACQGLAFVLTCIFQCSPVRGAWDTGMRPTPKCVNINAFYLSNAALNILTDLITYALPVRMILHLQTPTKQKIAVGVMFSLGFFACISSIVRMTFVPSMLVSADPTTAIAKPMYWSVIETNIGILAASIPSFKPIARRYLPRIIGEYSSGGRSYPGASSSRNFGKISNTGGEWAGSMPLKPVHARDGVTTTVITSRGDGLGDMSKTSSGSEQSLMANAPVRISAIPARSATTVPNSLDGSDIISVEAILGIPIAARHEDTVRRHGHERHGQEDAAGR